MCVCVCVCVCVCLYVCIIYIYIYIYRYLEPKVYEDLKHMVSTKKEEREAYAKEVTELLLAKVRGVGLESARVTGRAKHFYSIYQKMRSRGLTHVSEVHDLIAFRILVDDITACYQALGVVHTMWKPVPGRFKDYIALAKPNMYQSLHTTVIGPGGQRIEGPHSQQYALEWLCVVNVLRR
jgi:guanosine-3',5'-bis(diphosphate) 3'-pyrophosphohydrolase